MAVTLVMKKKIDRVTLIKTVASHGWMLDRLLMDDSTKSRDSIIDADIKVYIIYIKAGKHGMMVVYQPKIDEMTIIGPTAKSEKAMKNKIADIFEKGKVGSLPVENTDFYVNGLLSNKNFLTQHELDSLLYDAESFHADADINFYA